MLTVSLDSLSDCVVILSAIICAHNHPSGDPKPSSEDAAFTRELAQACKTMQIRLLDHLVIGDNRFYSFADETDILTGQ